MLTYSNDKEPVNGSILYVYLRIFLLLTYSNDKEPGKCQFMTEFCCLFFNLLIQTENQRRTSLYWRSFVLYFENILFKCKTNVIMRINVWYLALLLLCLNICILRSLYLVINSTCHFYKFG